MTQPNSMADSRWAAEQIEKYQAVYLRYSHYAYALQQILEKAALLVAPEAVIQTRPKSIPSFAEKIQRKQAKYRDPLLRMTDLCGGRVITQVQSEVRAMSEFIEKHFEIDWENSVDVGQRLKPSEFGYRSIHYIVQFRRGVFPTKEISVDIPEELYPDADHPMKAEIQVRTFLEHAWALFAHDRAYKGAFTLPAVWQRELAISAGMLEDIDRSFSRIQSGLATYAASYGAYLSEERLGEEIDILETVLACDPGNPILAHRLGRLFMTRGDWQKVIDLLTKYAETGYQPILRDLGVALCKVHAAEPLGAPYQQGQRYLEAACAEPNRDVDALASLASSWKPLDERKVRSFYRQAYEADPSDPYALGNYLVYEIANQRVLTPARLMTPLIEAAIQRCRDQVRVNMNLPWAFFNLGMFHLLQGQPYEGLAAYAKAIQLCTDDWMIETSLNLLEKLSDVGDVLQGYEWIRRLLLISRAIKFPSEPALKVVKAMALEDAQSTAAPVVIVAGTTDTSLESKAATYRALLLGAFHDFQGTLISGGTTAGISGLVGDVQEAYPAAIRTIGYVPKRTYPSWKVDPRYRQIRFTDGVGFSALEALQYWIDLVAAGIQPSQVKLLDVAGRTIAAVECRIALALGASVGVVEGSGYEAAKLLLDEDWENVPGLFPLPPDAMTARAFISSGIPKLDSTVRETIAKAIHESYREMESSIRSSRDPALAHWDSLLDDYKESNRQQADHISEKLLQIGLAVHYVKDQQPKEIQLTVDEVEVMAEMEHGRWIVERLKEGWKWAPERDVAKKTSPYILPWSQLAEEVREQNREIVRRIPEFLASVGMEIRRK